MRFLNALLHYIIVATMNSRKSIKLIIAIIFLLLITGSISTAEVFIEPVPSFYATH